MAFWGIEVKAGKPVTHSFDKVRQRLRISQATLGIGSATKKSLVQCNVGNKHPVFLCALLPDKTESCHLELEFEEADDVVFSVIGPQSVYLTGYYLSNSQRGSINSDTKSESYGEDIANSETEESVQHTDEDEYEDSFIDDDNPVVCPPSPVSSDEVDEKMLDKQNKKEKKGTRKLQRKKFRVIDSDDDATSQESGDSDNFLLSVFKSKKTKKSAVSEVREKIDQEALETSENKADCGISGCVTNDKADDAVVMPGEPERKNLQSNSLFPSDKVEPEKEIGSKERRKELFKETKALEDNVISHSNDFIDDEAQRKNAKTKNLSADLLASNAETSTKSKRKRKEQSDEVKSFGSSCGNHRKAFKEDKSAEAEAENRGGQDCLQRNIDNQKPTINGNSNHHSSSQSPSEVSAEGGQNSKKRRKEASIKETSVKSNDEKHSNALVEDHVNVIEDGKTNKDLPTTTEQDKLSTADRATNFDLVAESSKSKRTKKKKKKSKSQENVSILSEHEYRKSPMQREEGKFDVMSSQARTLSNGLTIEELASGGKDGEMAALGRKVKIFYTAMLKKDGRVFDSNIGKTPYKFRLGDEKIMQGWNVGLEGMRVGDKRRLLIPPSMGYGSRGAGENVPPNSWLVYDVDLVGVR